MKAGKHKKDKVNIITLGCSKNVVDSEVLLAQLRAGNIDAAHEAERSDANIIIVNTCGFIDRAKQESIDTILAYAEEKANGVIEKLFVTGCLSERYRDDLAAEIPEVDAFFGTMELPALLARFNTDYKHELIGERALTTPAHYAYLKIAEGCDRPCSFCAIPLMRGAHRSRTIESLVNEARFLVSRGVKEIMLIAQDLTYYGLDLYGKRRLDDLLSALAEVEGLKWMRLHYAFPSGFPTEILPIMREHNNICNYLDMPLQHISDNMLKAMRRGITRQKTKDLIDRIRDEVPGIALRTTMLVGFPGETEDDFEQLCNFIQEARFERLGVFTYSHEEKTHAHTFEDDVPAEEKEERAALLMEIQQDIAEEMNLTRVGQTLLTLIDRKEGGYYVGRSEHDSPEVDAEILIPADKPREIGEFYSVYITSAEPFDLYGEVVEETVAERVVL